MGSQYRELSILSNPNLHDQSRIFSTLTYEKCVIEVVKWTHEIIFGRRSYSVDSHWSSEVNTWDHIRSEHMGSYSVDIQSFSSEVTLTYIVNHAFLAPLLMKNAKPKVELKLYGKSK